MRGVFRGYVYALAIAMLVACGGGGGGGSGAGTTTPPVNQSPTATILASGDLQPNAADGSIGATVAGSVALDATASTDPDADVLSYEWSLVAKPTGSQATIASPRAAKAGFTPDLMGSYTLSLKVSDGKGGSSSQQVVIKANNRAPVSSLAVTAQFTAQPTNVASQSVTVGSNIVLDATNTTDPDGDSVSISFDLMQSPVGSTAGLSLTARTARLVPDTLGLYKVRVRGYDGKGASFETIYSFQADNRSPTAVIVTSGTTAMLVNSGSSTMNTSVGFNVMLDGRTSSDPDASTGDSISRWTWSLNTPTGSKAQLSSTSSSMTGFVPDMLGTYSVALTVVDSKGAPAMYTTQVIVNNRSPVANISTNATPIALPSAPRILIPAGTELTLRGTGSVDADGDPITYLWSIDSRPAGSTAALSATNVASPKITPDLEGSYVFRLRASDPSGAYSERTIAVDVGTHAPVAVLNRSRMSVLAGTVANASAALSYDDDGDSLSFSWSLDAKPSGSSAAVSSTSATASFTPDVPGTYVMAVQVSDGRATSVGYVQVLALANLSTSVALNFVPDKVKYSTGLDKMVITSSNPDSLRIVDPFTAAIRTVSLPLPVKNLGLSPDGKLAAVLHEGIVSLVDLSTGALIRSSSTGGAQTDAFVLNNGTIFLIGQTGGQWVNESIVALNGYTGVKIQQGSTFWMFYGTQYGILADRLNKVFLMEQGLSPADIDYFQFDPATGKALGSGDSPYHGDYPMSVPLYLSENQSILFTSAGNYFRTDTLNYAGVLNGVTRLLSLSNSSLQDETLALQGGPSSSQYYPYPPTYPSSYLRFTGSLFLPDGSLSLPLVNGSQAYGIQVFHSANAKHVLLVQTGSNENQGAGASYYVITR